MQSSCCFSDRITCIAYMTATSDVIRVQNIKSVNYDAFDVLGNRAVNLYYGKRLCRWSRKRLFPRKCIFVLNRFVLYFLITMFIFITITFARKKLPFCWIGLFLYQKFPGQTFLSCVFRNKKRGKVLHKSCIIKSTSFDWSLSILVPPTWVEHVISPSEGLVIST